MKIADDTFQQLIKLKSIYVKELTNIAIDFDITN